MLLAVAVSGQYQDNNPSDATTGLPYTLNAGGATIVTPCTSGSETTGGTLNAATNTPISIVPAVLCGNSAASPADVWYRLDIPAGDNRFRITVKDGASNPLTNAAMAAYVAPSASGPFELIDCSIGGNPVNAANPSLEVSCIPGGSKVYIRIWEEGATTSTKNFSLCVQGQNWADLGTRQTIYDTPCTAAPLPTAVAGALFHNTFACAESFPMEPSCGGYTGGDIWFSGTVASAGGIRLWGALAAANMIQRMNFAVYLAPTATCTNVDQFTEVACFNATFTSSTLANFGDVRCLLPGSTVYIRAYTPTAAQNSPLRFGSFQFRVQTLGSSWGTATNNVPCMGTVPTLTMGACPSYGSGLASTNSGACTTPGIPAPGCGSFGSSTIDVWYKFVAPANGTVEIRVNGNTSTAPPTNAAAALYAEGPAGCGSPMTLIECNADHGPGHGAYIVRNGLTPGKTYYIRVWNEQPPGNVAGVFNICLSSPTPAAGNCFYLLKLSFDGNIGAQGIRRIIGTDTVTYMTTMSEPNQTFLIEVPSGSNVHFFRDPTLVSGLSGGTWISFFMSRLGEAPFADCSTGGPVTGPTTPCTDHYYTVACTLRPAREDCLGSRTICGPSTVVDTMKLRMQLSYAGYAPDLTAENRGCLTVEQRAGRWFVFRAQANGRVGFTLQGTFYPADDHDFAIWDTGLQPVALLPNVTPSVCSPNGPPIRCSSAKRGAATGLRANIHNRFSEGSEGFGWLSPLDVIQDHVYLLYVVNNNITEWGFGSGPYPPPGGDPAQNQVSLPFTLSWTQMLNAGGATDNTILDCTRIILPVELLGFDAKPLGQDVLVQWTTGSEKNSDHFAVERSTDGVAFITIGIVEAAGNSLLPLDYTFLDNDPEQGLSYYRLRMVDEDGSFTYGPIAAVLMNSRERVEVFPNPSHDRVFVNFSTVLEGPVHVSVHDATGRQVMERIISKADDAYGFDLDISRLTQGSYFLRSTTDAGITATGRFVKQ